MKAAPIAIGLMVGSGLFATTLKGEVDAPRDISGLNAHETHASATLLGQFRTSLSSWLWLRTDLYLHNGVEMRQLTEAERARGKQGVGNSEHGQDALHDDSSIVTVVPGKEQDFRGIFGDIERATKAYKRMEGHAHNDPKSALPLFRLMTWVDPQFIPGWITGATVLGRERTDAALDMGIELLKEGLEHNPNSPSVLSELGRFYASKKHDFTKAVPYLRRAVELEVEPSQLDEVEADGLLSAYRWLCLSYRELNKMGQMHTVARRGLKLFEDDPVLLRASMEAPYIFTEMGQREWIQQAIEAAEHEEDDHDHHDHDHSNHH